MAAYDIRFPAALPTRDHMVLRAVTTLATPVVLDSASQAIQRILTSVTPIITAGASVTYRMRAYHTVAPTGYVYWTSTTYGDTSSAPYPVGELSDVVVVA